MSHTLIFNYLEIVKMKDVFVDPPVRGKPFEARKLVIEIELLDPESFDPVALTESVERSFLRDAQPALKVIAISSYRKWAPNQLRLLTGFNK